MRALPSRSTVTADGPAFAWLSALDLTLLCPPISGTMDASFLLQRPIESETHMKLPDYFGDFPPEPEELSVSNSIARLIDGLGYRLYWAMEGLTEAG